MKHKFNARLFCVECGADAIGLQGFGKSAMECLPKSDEQARANAYDRHTEMCAELGPFGGTQA